MTVIEAIQKRYSCRVYQDKPIEPDKIKQIFEAARLAPSAKNLQDWRFIVVTDKTTKVKLAQAANNQTFLSEAGAIIIACSNSDYIMRCGQAIGPIDVAIAIEHICLEATALGIGSCMVGKFDHDAVGKVLDLPEHIEPNLFVALGYRDKQADVAYLRTAEPLPMRRRVKDIIIGWIK